VGHLLASGVCLLTLREGKMRLMRVNLRPYPERSHAIGLNRALTGGMTPYDWPSQKGMSPFVSIIMWYVSPVAFGPVIFSTDLILALKGFLGLKVFRGSSPSSSSVGTLFLAVPVAAA